MHFIILFLTLCCWLGLSNADTVGSNVSVSIEPFYTFPNTHNDDNAILAFGWMQSGFALQDQNTTCSFMSAFPVSGTVNINGGVLTLMQDLIMKDVASLQGVGTILATDRILDLCPTITALSVSQGIFSGTSLVLRDDLLLTGTITFQGNCSIMGNGYTLILDPQAQMIVAPGATLALSNIDIAQVYSNNIMCVDNTGSILLNNASFILSNNYIFQNGSLQFLHDVYVMGGAYQFIYESYATSTIAPESVFCITDEVSLVINNFTYNGNPPLYQQEQSATLMFDHGNLIVGPNGLQILNGTVYFNHAVDVIATGTSAATGFIIGNNTFANDPVLYMSSDGVINHVSGYVVFNTASPNAIQSGSPTATLMRQDNSFFVIQSNLTVPQVILQLASDFVPPLQFAPGTILSYASSSVELPDVTLQITGEQTAAYVYDLVGSNGLQFNRGELPAYLMISGQNNLVEGNGGISGPITLQDGNTQLSADIFGRINNEIMFNGGTLLLQDNLRLGPAASLVGPGSISLGAYVFDLGPSKFSSTTPLEWSGTGGTINMNGALSLATTWTVSGACILNGNNNTLALQPGGSIMVMDGSSLTLEQVKVTGIQATNIACATNAAFIDCAGAQLYLSGNYTFTVGSLYFEKNDLIQGNGYSFAYTSNATSTIADNATLKVSNATLTLGKQTINQNSPLTMATVASTLSMDNVTWIVPAGGFQISQGTLQFIDNISWEILSTSTANGLYFGAPVGDQLTVDLTSGSVINHLKGHLVLNMANPNGFIVHAESAQFNRAPGTIVDIKNNINFTNLTISTNPAALTIVEPPALLTFNNVQQMLLSTELLVTGTRYNATTVLLYHGGLFDVESGTQPGSILVSGSNNIVEGPGNLSGTLTLTDTGATCMFGMSGSLFANVTLNGGTLNLNSDINLGNNAQIVGPGNVILNSNNVNFGKSDLTITTPLFWQGNRAILNMNGDLTISTTWTFSGNCEIDGAGHVLSLDAAGQLSIAHGSNLILRNVIVQNVNGTNIACVDNTGQLILDATRLIQNGNFVFATGSLLIEDEVQLYGGYNFIYESAMSATIDSQATLHVLDFTNFVIQSSTPLAQLIYLEDGTSNLELDDCTLTITGLGTQFTNGRVYCENNVTIDIISTSTGNGLALGNNTPQGDLSFELRPGTTVNFPEGHLLTQLINPYAINSKSNTAQIIRGDTSFFYLANTTILANLTLNVSEFALLQTAPGAQMMYQNVSNVLPTGDFDITGGFGGGFVNVLSGSDNYLSLSRGLYPLVTAIGSPGSMIMGNGTITGPIIFLGPGSSTSWVLNGVCDSYIDLNGSTIYLGRDLSFGPNGDLNGPGTMNLSSYSTVFNPKNTLFNTGITWIADQGTISLSNDADLTGTWIITGTCTINGNGRVLNLAGGGALQVASGAFLTLRDMELDNIAGTNISCMDNTGIIYLDGVIWNQSDDYQFTAGALQFEHENHVVGGYQFVYQTSQTSTVLQYSDLIFDVGCTFSYDPSVYSNQLINFIDATSVWELRGGIFASTTGGVVLNQGTLLISANSQLNAESTGISLGTGQIGQDMQVTIQENKQITLNSGSLNYYNINQSSFEALDDRGRVNLVQGTLLRLYQTLNLGPCTLFMENGVTLASANNTDLIGSILPQGTLFRVSL